jgi:hypothetical protein
MGETTEPEKDDGVIPDGIVPPYIQERLRDRKTALQRECPACQAKVGELCTVPTDEGRRYLRNSVHLAREYCDETEETSTNGETSEKGMQ